MKLTYKYRIDNEFRLRELCSASRCLYNQALYAIKQSLNGENRLGYAELNLLMREMVNLEGTVNYRLLKTQVSQQILMLLDKNMKSYYKAHADYLKHPKKYKGEPELPRYKREYNILIYTNQSCAIRNSKVILSKDLTIDIPQWKYEFASFSQVRILPRNGYMEVEIVYEKECVSADVDANKCAAIDLGVNNLATLVMPDSQPIIFSGKVLKSDNQYYNKRKAFLHSVKDKSGIKKYTRQLYEMEQRRAMKINDFMHKASRMIINWLVSHGIGRLVIGLNKGWKDSVNLRKKTNQHFCGIPHSRLIKMLEYKCSMVGILFETHEEAHTSKCDALAMEPVRHHDEYLGRRVKRGLFQSSIGKMLNADVNGALNIMRKVVGDSLVKVIVDSGLLFNPIKIRHVFDANSLLRKYQII